LTLWFVLPNRYRQGLVRDYAKNKRDYELWRHEVVTALSHCITSGYPEKRHSLSCSTSQSQRKWICSRVFLIQACKRKSHTNGAFKVSRHAPIGIDMTPRPTKTGLAARLQGPPLFF